MDTKQRKPGNAPQRGARKPRPQAAAARPQTKGRKAAPSGRRMGKQSPVQKRRALKKTDPRAARQRQAQRRVSRPKHPAPAVVYTQPKPFNRKRLLLELTIVAAVVLAVVMGLSIFFKVKYITVSGAQVYSEWSIREASGIQEGDNLLTFSKARAYARIQAARPYVEKVRIGIKLPNTVNIHVEEIDVVYAVKSNGLWWLINSEGKVVEQASEGVDGNYTKILGVELDNPVAGEMAVPLEEAPTQTDEAGETVPVTVTAAQRFTAILTILDSLERNDVVGEAASVDVTSLSRIELWYGTRYQVNLGDSQNLDYKISYMKAAIDKISEYQTGKLDVSFTTWKDKAGFEPFDA